MKHPPAPQPGFPVTTGITQQNVPIVQSIPSPGLYANLGVPFGGSISTHETGLSFCGKDAAIIQHTDIDLLFITMS